MDWTDQTQAIYWVGERPGALPSLPRLVPLGRITTRYVEAQIRSDRPPTKFSARTGLAQGQAASYYPDRIEPATAHNIALMEQYLAAHGAEVRTARLLALLQRVPSDTPLAVLEAMAAPYQAWRQQQRQAATSAAAPEETPNG